MKNPLLILLGVVFGLAIFLFGQWKCTERRLTGEIIQRDVYIEELIASINTDPVTDTVTDTVFVPDPYPVKVPVPVQVKDSLGNELREYTGTEKGENYLVHWKILVAGELKLIEVLPGSYLLNSEISVTRNIVLPERTPVNIQRPEQRFKTYFVGSVGISSKTLREVSTELMVIHRKGWGVIGGLEYNVQHGEMTYKAGIAIKLNRNR